MAIGTVLYVPVMLPKMIATDWTQISLRTWMALIYSALFALCVAYTIWYVAVRSIGSARTSVYSNIVPIVAMLTAVVFLGERLTGARLLGAACVLIGVALRGSERPRNEEEPASWTPPRKRDAPRARRRVKSCRTREVSLLLHARGRAPC